MKKIGIRGKFLILIISFVLFSIGCDDPNQARWDRSNEILNGEHKLRKIVERTETNLMSSGSFFFFVGDFRNSTNTQTLVKFSWQMNDGIYAFSSLPLEKIRIKLSEKAVVPSVSFMQDRCWSGGIDQIPEFIDCWTSYAVITVKESDWPTRVELPLNN